MAEALLENGCTVIISSSNPDKVGKKVSILQSSYPSAKDRISGHACDLGDGATLENNIKTLFEKVGKLDHVVYTAGDSLAINPIENLKIENMHKAGNVRFFGPLLVAKYAAKALSGGPKSSIILTTGAVSERPIANWTLINSYATGLHGMTRGMALDLKPIRVNLVSPGAVDTELWDAFTKEQKQSFIADISGKAPTGAIGTVEDVAEAYLYLLRDRNIAGAMISTSSGTLLMGP